MQNKQLIIAAALLAASVVADPNPFCCELYTEENYLGQMHKVCLEMNWWGDVLDSSGFSFHHAGGNRNSKYPELTDNMESYKCGIQVVADFCKSQPTQYRDETGAT